MTGRPGARRSRRRHCLIVSRRSSVCTKRSPTRRTLSRSACALPVPTPSSTKWLPLTSSLCNARANRLKASLFGWTTTHAQPPPYEALTWSSRFFLVPFRNSILASYIARYDSWYNRQLYVPMVSRQFLVPTMSEEEPTFNELKPEEPLSPFGALLQSNVESYVREAEYSLQIKLFQIEGTVV